MTSAPLRNKPISKSPALSRIYRGVMTPLPNIDQAQPVVVLEETRKLTRGREHLFTTYLVSALSPQASQWMAALRKRVQATRTLENGDRYGSLTAAQLNPLHLAQVLGGWHQANSRDELCEEGLEVEQCAYVNKSFVSVLLKNDKPIGYCTFDVKWDIPACPKEEVRVELDLGEAWLAPSARGQSLSGSLIAGLVRAYRLCKEAIDSHCCKGPRRVVRLELLVGGDVCSTSGEGFLEMATDMMVDELHFEALLIGSPKFKYVRVQCDPRW